jgi:electron transfer flavoprotein alpha/beta subunit
MISYSVTTSAKGVVTRSSEGPRPATARSTVALASPSGERARPRRRTSADRLTLSHDYPVIVTTSRPAAMPRKHRLRQIVVVTKMLIQAWCHAPVSISRTVS